MIKLIYYGSSILRRRSRPIETITDEIRLLASEMCEWVLKHRGLGLAAPQVGHDLRLFVALFPDADDRMEFNRKPEVFINPVLSNPSLEMSIREEACFSIPGVYCEVLRPLRIGIEAMNLDGKLFKRDLEGLAARIVMHENDHINGVLMIDRMPARDRKSVEPLLRKIQKQHRLKAA